MIWIYIFILWLVYIVMTVSSLSYIKYQDHQILGVTLSKLNADNPEIKGIINSFKKLCYLILSFSMGFSLLLLMPFIRHYADFLMFFMMALNLFANWISINHHQKKLLTIKEQNKWIYSNKKIVTVDLNVSKVKGKSKISSVWIWIFLILSFIPMIFLLINSDMRKFYPLGFSFIGPVCQLLSTFLYYQMINQPSRIIGHKQESNLLFAQKYERINSTTATLTALSMLIFWILFSLSILHIQNNFLIIVPITFLIIAVLTIENWHQKKIHKLEEAFTDISSEYEENIQEQESTWKWGCYYNPNDLRIFVPKRFASMGWTINIGRPIGKVLYFGTIALVFVVIIFLAYGGTKDYEIELEGPEMMIDATMYDISIEKEQINTVSIINQLPNGIRTNGYGGVNKSFGHFTFDKYGNCMLYVYNNVNQYVVIDLKGSNPNYIIINDKTMEETETLYQAINSWLSE